MKNKVFTLTSISLLLALVFIVSSVSAVITHTETFDNSGLTGNYLDGSFLGNGNITWNYVQARDQGDYAINGAGMIFRDTAGKIYSNTISGGIEDFSVKLKKGSASSGNRQVELFINGVSKGLSGEFDDDSTHTFAVNDLNLTGNVVIEIRNIKEVHVVIDDITWTEFSEPTQEEPEEVTACDLEGNSGDNLNIKRIDFTNEGMSGADPKQFGDDNEWFPLDNIKVEINVENNGDEKIENIEVQWGLYDTESDEWVIELDDEKDFDLKKNKDDTLTISFKLEKALDIDLDQLSDGEHYKFYVIANGYDNEIEKDVCTTDSEDILIVVESDFVVLDKIQFQEPVSCGADLSLITEVWNIGDQDQEGIYIKISNSELGIDKTVEVGDIDAFDSQDLNVLLTMPENVQEKSYLIKLTVYDESDDVYVNDYNDDDSIFSIDPKVECSSQQQDNAIVSANLISGGNAGEELVVKATITNTGGSATFVLNAAGYSSWASSANIDQTSIVLASGESKDVLFTFNVKDDASSEQTFNIEILSDSKLVLSQPVSVEITSKSKSFGNLINKDNWYFWGLGVLNIVLVMIIILVALRVAKK